MEQNSLGQTLPGLKDAELIRECPGVLTSCENHSGPENSQTGCLQMLSPQAKMFHGNRAGKLGLVFHESKLSLGDKILPGGGATVLSPPPPQLLVREGVVMWVGWGLAMACQALRTRWGAQAIGLQDLGGDMDCGHQESRQSLAGHNGALASSWVKESRRE